MDKIIKDFIIFPLRVFVFMFSFIGSSIYLLLINPNHLSYCCDIMLEIAGIKKQNNLKIQDTNSIIIFNHINLFDGWVMFSLFNKSPTIVARKEFTTGSKWEFFTKYLNIIPVSRKGKEGTVQKINDFIDNSENNLLLAPDSCDSIQEGSLIAPFKNSIFITDKRKIIPVVIRYTTLNKSTKLNWDDLSIYELFFSIMKDGNINVYIDRLDDCYKNKEETTENYRDRVWSLMTVKLHKLPTQYPKIC
jgi:1-acyl-sn-glycerol-3-phosphate acyltransferase